MPALGSSRAFCKAASVFVLDCGHRAWTWAVSGGQMGVVERQRKETEAAKKKKKADRGEPEGEKQGKVWGGR